MWTTQLMADYYLSTKLSMLRYGATSGLEQSVNTTTDQFSELRRQANTGSLTLGGSAVVSVSAALNHTSFFTMS